MNETKGSVWMLERRRLNSRILNDRVVLIEPEFFSALLLPLAVLCEIRNCLSGPQMKMKLCDGGTFEADGTGETAPQENPGNLKKACL
jgi:hypothetical protein